MSRAKGGLRLRFFKPQTNATLQFILCCHSDTRRSRDGTYALIYRPYTIFRSVAQLRHGFRQRFALCRNDEVFKLPVNPSSRSNAAGRG